MMVWAIVDDRYTADILGELPAFLDEMDTRPAAEQIGERYQGGWDSFKGFTMGDYDALKFPGDPPLYPIALTALRGEWIVLYPASFVAIIQPDRSFDVARIDQHGHAD